MEISGCRAIDLGFRASDMHLGVRSVGLVSTLSIWPVTTPIKKLPWGRYTVWGMLGALFVIPPIKAPTCEGFNNWVRKPDFGHGPPSNLLAEVSHEFWFPRHIRFQNVAGVGP